MLLKIVACIGVGYLLGSFLDGNQDSQSITKEEWVVKVQSENKGYQYADIEDRIIKNLPYLNGKILPKDYESRFFTLSRGSINTYAFSNDELNEVNQIFDSIKNYVFARLTHGAGMGLEKDANVDLEAVYIYFFSHKATTLNCLTSDDICPPIDRQHISTSTKHISENDHEWSMRRGFKDIFSFDHILDNSKSIKYKKLSGGEPAVVQWGRTKEDLYETIMGFLELSKVIEEGEELPTMGYRAVFVVSGADKGKYYIHTSSSRLTLKFDTEKLTEMLKTMTGKEISRRTGLARKLNEL
ncbi:hypothetical protein [Endozoicomonas sp. 4G]|uniref:hypothetical protein n=1 Tax=Endozoicomonas sp. 4G TaxID=2872754 RepID=UPI002078D12C|nr:hypothetical protein [Endozoicomonas sp. 4G]